MSIFEEALALAVSSFEAEGPARAPSADPFGSDISCIEDVDEKGREVEGEEMLAEAWARRLSTPRGALGEGINPDLDDDPDYGLDCRSFLHRKMTATEIDSIPGRIRGELMKDERTGDVKVKMSRFDVDTGLECELDGYTSRGPFRLVLAVTPDNVKVFLRGES